MSKNRHTAEEIVAELQQIDLACLFSAPALITSCAYRYAPVSLSLFRPGLHGAVDPAFCWSRKGC